MWRKGKQYAEIALSIGKSQQLVRGQTEKAKSKIDKEINRLIRELYNRQELFD
jgi:primase-polymerase (primpol)-like protein